MCSSQPFTAFPNDPFDCLSTRLNARVASSGSCVDPGQQARSSRGHVAKGGGQASFSALDSLDCVVLCCAVLCCAVLCCVVVLVVCVRVCLFDC